MTILAVIFDCDGVLVDSEGISIAVERKHLHRIGLEYDLEDYLNRFVGLTDDDFYRELESDYGDLFKGDFPSDFAESVKSERWLRFEKELSSIEGVEAFLDHWDGAMAVASSSPVASLRRKLEITGLHRRFDPHIYSGEQVERGKPAPDLFLFAASRLGCIADACLIIEDSVNGVRAGLAAGMEVWGFTGGAHADPGLHDRLKRVGAREVFPSFSDILSKCREFRAANPDTFQG